MDFIKEIEQNHQNQGVQKLNLRDVMEFIIDASESTQIQLIKLLDNELKLTPISKAKDVLGCSYNGVKNFRKTETIGSKIFAILKDIDKID